VRLLLDTHVVLWQLGGVRRMGKRAQRQVDVGEPALSVVSFVEIGIKVSVGKLVVPDDLEAQIRREGVSILRLTPAHGLALAELPFHHRDPFDRLLIAQARSEGMTIVTADARMRAYDVPVINASA